MPLHAGNAPPTMLIGRNIESAALIERVDAAREGNGGAIVLRGAPGIGKTSMLEVARAHAASAGLQVLRTTGVQSETHLPFAGLHQLLRPVFNDVDRLPAPYGKALRGAFGLSDEPVASHYLVAMSTLQLLSEASNGTSPTFHGGNLVAAWLVTGESRAYNAPGAFFNAVSPAKSVFEGGPGAWEVVLNYSYIDLDAGSIRGGKFWRVTPMVNWFLSDNVRLAAVYGYGVLDRFDLQGATQFFQFRIQTSL